MVGDIEVALEITTADGSVQFGYGDPRDPETMGGFQKGTVDTKMYCLPFEVTETSKQQRVVVEVEVGES